MPAPAAATAVLGTLKILGRLIAREATRRASSWLLGHIRGCVAGAVCLILFMIVLCAAIAAPIQLSTVAWPVPIPAPGAEQDGWTAGGWSITSTFGWRPSPTDGERQEFHDGVDIVGPTFCLHCAVMSIADARVAYIGWDLKRDRTKPPGATGGGMIVELDTGPRGAGDTFVPPEMRTIYGHLAPYRLYVQLQGRIEDPWDQDEYRPYHSYGEVGTGELLPAITDAEIAITCRTERQSRVPEFVLQRIGPGTLLFTYDKPIVAPDECTVSFAWPPRGGDWIGWNADDPGAGTAEDGQVSLAFTTPIDEGVTARNVALRFRAHLLAPPPPPTPTPQSTILPEPSFPSTNVIRPATAVEPHAVGIAVAAGPASSPACRRAARSVHCTWNVAAIPRLPFSPFQRSVDDPEATVQAATQTAALQRTTDAAALHARQLSSAMRATSDDRSVGAARNWCANTHLVRVDANDDFPCLTPDTAAAWQRARIEIAAAVGLDWLARYPSDLMRDPTFVPRQNNQIVYSWHKTGRAVDVPQSGPGVRHVQEGAYERLYVSGVDITNIMEAHGFRRIPSNPARPEWWHYELQGGLRWTCAMRQIYDVAELQRWFPELGHAWSAPDCAASGPVDDGDPASRPCQVVPHSPGLQTAIDFIAGPGAVVTGRFNDTRVIDGRTTRHGGLDIAVPEGRPIHAFVGGSIVSNAYSSVGGNYVIVQSDDGRRTYYGHLQAPSPRAVGTAIARGDVLGAVGQTGMATGPHVHFQLSDTTGTWIDPERMLAAGDVPSLPCVPGHGDEPSMAATCTEGQPIFDAAVSSVPGCGPPLQWTTRVKMLDHVIGHIDLTGTTTGPHLHLGLQIRNGLSGSTFSQTDICGDSWVPPVLRSLPMEEREYYVFHHWREHCWTDAVDPLDFLPRAHATAALPGARSAPVDGEPYQLPPPGTEGALLHPVPPNQEPPGEYWSPYADAGRFGGGGILEWLRNAICAFLSWIGLPCRANL